MYSVLYMRGARVTICLAVESAIVEELCRKIQGDVSEDEEARDRDFV